jgi:hypothetical protein
MHTLPRLAFLATTALLIAATVVVPLTGLQVDVLVVALALAAVVIDRLATQSPWRGASLAASVALVVAAARIIVVSSGPGSRIPDGGVVAAVGRGFTGGNPVVGCGIALVALVALAAITAHVRMARARAAVALGAAIVLAAAVQLAAPNELPRALAFSTGIGLLLAVPAVVAIVGSRARAR